MKVNYREIIFQTVGFSYDGVIELEEYDGVSVYYDGTTARIGYHTISELCRGYFLFAREFDKGCFEIYEKAHFKTCGCMIDVSRNGVMRTDAVKQYINCMAALGMNMLMLYTEDTYEIEEYPYFGYLRGRYSCEELREIDAYAAAMGVELIPCIQTLAHLEQFLKYSCAREIRDTSRILLAGEEKTYAFIEAEIRAVKKAFSSRRIHIGMDEAHEIGRGAYLDKNGYRDQYEIMTQHLNRVVELCKKYDLVPMMWNDMFFTMSTPTRSYHDYKNANFKKEMIEQLPDVDMVYWDYGNGLESDEEKEIYKGMIEKCHELGKKTIFAGGIVTWSGFLPKYTHIMQFCPVAMQACLETGVEEVFATMWGDDGTETNIFLSVPYLPVYAEYCYKGLNCTAADIEKSSEFLTKCPFAVTKSMGVLDSDTRPDKYRNTDTIGKGLLYSDLLFQLGPEQDEYQAMLPQYQAALEVLNKIDASPAHAPWYGYGKLIYEIAIAKIEIRLRLQKAYQAGDREYLKQLTETTLPWLRKKYETLKEVHKKQWHSTYKTFGFETLSFRYGGVISRIDDCIAEIKAYLDGETACIAVLDQKVLPIDNTGYHASHTALPSVIY